MQELACLASKATLIRLYVDRKMNGFRKPSQICEIALLLDTFWIFANLHHLLHLYFLGSL